MLQHFNYFIFCSCKRTDTLATDFFFRNLIEAARLAMLVSGDVLLAELPVVDQSLPPNNCNSTIHQINYNN